ncbi:MAG: hypothetical protein AAF805_08630 [Planctomycetota bacterium]
MKRLGLLGAATLLAAAVGCGKPAMEKPAADSAAAGPKPERPAPEDAADGTPVFSLAWSEYPSWSVFGVAHERGLVDKAEGKIGPVEKQWGVDIVLVQADYDTCLGQYANSTVDAVCMTNMDSLAPATGRDSVAVLPTSTSVGADACLAVGVGSLDELKGVATFGLEKSVSQYAFERCLEVAGEDPAEYEFRNMDPANAALAMQTGDDAVKSIMVWNPFVLQTLRDQPDAKRMFDSSNIPEEIIDMVVVGKDALDKEGGAAFAHAVIDCFYRVNALLADRGQRAPTLKMLGEKFSSLSVEDMEAVVQETRMYGDSGAGVALFEKEDFRDGKMPAVVEFCLTHDIVTEEPTVGFDDADAQLNFDASYMKAVAAKSAE